MHYRNIFRLFICFLFAGAPMVQAAPTLIPTGLGPGDMYQLAFLTSTARDGRSGNIADYNAHVQAAANAADIGFGSTSFGTDVTWSAIVSTIDVITGVEVDARDNALVVGEVYNLGGFKVADSFADMWDGSIDNPIIFMESGASINTSVWTGSTVSGEIIMTGLGLGSIVAGIGGSNDINGSWIQDSTEDINSELRLYALSEKLTVPAAVPTPSAMLLMGTGLLGLIGWKYRRTKNS